MKCPYCGKELVSEATRCDGCGASVSNTNQPSQNTSNQTSNFNYEQPKSSNKSGIVVIILFIAIAALLSYFLFFAGGSSDNNENTNNRVQNNEEVEDNAIVKSRKKAYLSTAATDITAVKNTMSRGYIKLYSTDTMIFVPVGDLSKCGELESGGSSPFSKGWNYAYVGITYTGSQYNSYFISEDDSLYGIPLSSYEELINGNIDIIYNNHNGEITDEISNKLKEFYNISENKKMSVEEIEDIKSAIIPANESVKNVVFVSASAGCKY